MLSYYVQLLSRQTNDTLYPIWWRGIEYFLAHRFHLNNLATSRNLKAMFFFNCTFTEVHETCLRSWCEFSPASFVLFLGGGGGFPQLSELLRAAQAQQMGSLVLLRNFSLHLTVKLCTSISTNITQSTAREWTESTPLCKCQQVEDEKPPITAKLIIGRNCTWHLRNSKIHLWIHMDRCVMITEQF